MTAVALVYSPVRRVGRFAELGEGLFPPLGILSLAAYLRDKVEGVRILALDGLQTGWVGTLERILADKPQILGISFNTLTAGSAFAFSREVRAKLPDTLILLGGAHATALPEDSLRLSGADAVVIGEGEETLVRIVRSFEKAGNRQAADFSAIPGIAYRSAGAVKVHPPGPYIRDLDTLPFPARDLVDLKSYRGWYLTKRRPDTTVLFSRGCPFRCLFCSNKVWNVSEPRVRFRSPENVADEMERLRDTLGIREVFDNSDEFNNNLPHAKAICRELIRRRTGVTWKTQLRAWPLDEELVSLMAQAGCWYAHLGIESGNQETLDGICKQITIGQVVEACRLLKRHRIKVMGLFMLFNVWEEKGALKFEDAAATARTLDFADRLVKERLVDYLGWSITEPYPGSPLYDIALRHNLIKPALRDDWDAWLTEEFSVLQLPGVSDRDVARLKSRGSLIRAKLLLRSGGFGLRDFTYILKKGFKVVHNEFRSVFKAKGKS